MFDIWFLKAVFVPLCFWLFSWLKLIQTLQFGGVSESSRSPLHDGHRDFKNWSRDAWENWSWSWHQKHRHHFFAILSISKWGLAASTSIFSGISALIFKISVPIIKRRSWGFWNTPNIESLDKFWLRKQPKTKWSLKSNIKPIFGFFYFLETAITWLKIIQTLHVGGVLESSGPPLDYGHRNFLNWCILGWEIEENQSAILNESNCILVNIPPQSQPLLVWCKSRL